MVSGERERRNYTGAMEYCGLLGGGLASPSNLMALRNYVLLKLGGCGEKGGGRELIRKKRNREVRDGRREGGS